MTSLGGSGKRRKGNTCQASEHNENVFLNIIVVAIEKVFSLGKAEREL
jgi:hypothetical protein